MWGRFVALLAVLAATRQLWSGDSPPAVDAEPAQADICQLQLELVDGKTGEPLPGIVRILDADGGAVELDELVNRGQGIERRGPIHDWWVLPGRRTVSLPAGPLTIHALAGLESELAMERIDLTGRETARIRVVVTRFYRARAQGQVAGNTHLHLMKLSKQQTDRYLQEVPLADGLDIVFVSYLERALADSEYSSNHYTREDLHAMSHEHLRFGHGEEHRHNFESQGEGYGHILLLDIPYIIRPVSIGPGIARAASDAPPLQRGIDEARRSGGKVVWAHNLFGFEDIPNWITGRVHANNIFDGSERGSYKDTYYRYLNIGLRVPFSTGTDWFIYDFSRVYVRADRPLTPTEWLDRLAAGQSYITNGPLLEFTVDEQPIGSVIDLSEPREVVLRGRAVGRTDFKRIEIVQNCRVVGRAESKPEGGHFAASIELRLAIDEPAWLALRSPPPPVPNDPELQEPVVTNEFGGRIFAHTSPVYVDLARRRVFDRDVAAGLLNEMRSDWKQIETKAVFANAEERSQVEEVYRTAIEQLEQQMEQ